jgi:hypothetical protein
MSPVSRGRKPKKSQKKGKPRVSPPATRTSPRTLPPGLVDLVTRDSRDWWEKSHDHVLELSGALRDEPGSLELEQATAELLGGELHAALGREKMGFDMDGWATQLVDRAAKRAQWEHDIGALWLMHGVAMMGSYGLGEYAAEQAAKVTGSVSPAVLREQPDWLGGAPAVTGEVQAIRDAYGTRLGVVAGFSYPGRADPVPWLLDIDGSGFITIAGAWTSGSSEEAVGAWRAEVGSSADSVVLGKLDAGALMFLVKCVQSDQLVWGRESRPRMDNWYRPYRRLEDITQVLSDRGVELPREPARGHVDLPTMIGEFTAWYTVGRGQEPDAELVGEVAGEWLDCVVPGTERLISPARTAFFRGLIGDWREPYAAAGLDLLVEWIRWLGEETGLAEPLIDRAL